MALALGAGWGRPQGRTGGSMGVTMGLALGWFCGAHGTSTRVTAGQRLGPTWGLLWGGTATAPPGVTVPVSPQGSLEDGRIIDTSLSRDPLQVELGKRQVIPGERGWGAGGLTGIRPG